MFLSHPKRGVAFSSTAAEILYGGAAGVGNSDLRRYLLVLFRNHRPPKLAKMQERVHKRPHRTYSELSSYEQKD
jgi:hypothetical protein